jgi:uncharacterized damage-inducible protein DinB
MDSALGLSFGDLMEYTAWQRGKWHAWFGKHPDALRVTVGANGDGRFGTVGDLVKHIFGAELRYAQRLRGQPLSELTSLPSDDVEALFAQGAEGRRGMAQLVAEWPDADWDTPREFRITTYHVTTTPRKIVGHTLLHEIRHWAQIATLCRLNGLAGEPHDFLMSPVWSGEIRSA